MDVLRLLGETFDVDESVLSTIERLMSHLYGMQMEHRVNNTQYRKFIQGKAPDPQELHLTHDELQQYVKRCNYQSYVWKQASVANPNMPSPSRHLFLGGFSEMIF